MQGKKRLEHEIMDVGFMDFSRDGEQKENILPLIYLEAQSLSKFSRGFNPGVVVGGSGLTKSEGLRYRGDM